MKKLFLNDTFILCLVVANAIVIALQDSGWQDLVVLDVIDNMTTILFLVECIVKINAFGFKAYISDGWNKMDFLLTLVALPSLLLWFFPQASCLSALLALRVFRVFKFFRVVRFFPNIEPLIKGVKLAMRDSLPVMAGFVVLIAIFSLLNCSLFKACCPDYFEDPIHSFYTTFKLFTVEGWYEIPEDVAHSLGDGFWGAVVKVYFSLLLIIGGIFGLSIVNSVFVDSMVSDNNDSMEKKLDEMNKKIDELTRRLGKE